MVRESERGDAMVDDLLRFSRHTFSASALALSWLSISQARRAPSVIGMNEAFLGEYFSQGISVDPFIACLDSGTDCSSLWQLQAKTAPDTTIASYAAFLGKHGYCDEMDFVFTFEDIPIAVLSLFGEQRFQFDPDDATHLHEFLSSFIACHPFTQKWRRQRALRDTFELTPREIEVVEHMRLGNSNGQIAASLGVSLTTVKTHVARVLDKVDVPSRSALAAFANQL